MRALREIAVEEPVSESFLLYAYKFIGPCAGLIASIIDLLVDNI
jgi:L-asparagine transporter-like permease